MPKSGIRRWIVTFEIYVYAKTKEIAIINATGNVSKHHISDVKKLLNYK